MGAAAVAAVRMSGAAQSEEGRGGIHVEDKCHSGGQT